MDNWNTTMKEVIARFQNEWNAHGRPPEIARYLRGMNDVQTRDALRQLIEADIKNRRQQKYRVSADDYCDIHLEAKHIAEDLLAAGTQSIPDIGTAGPDHCEVATLTHENDQLPDRIGKYEILGVLGSGGMGIVYKAKELGDVSRQVALKVIRPEYKSDHSIARFEAERQALAMMNHDHIARVFDTGKTDDGRPFLAMEFVHGQPIAEYCDAHELSVQKRLQLFMEVCDGIQHAHNKGILHRDIKSANVLVNESDGNPSVKIIDFGLAKLFDSVDQLTDKTVATKLGQIVGTLETMSPEQARSEAVDAMTDVYSLGVLLYQLITGDLPLDLRNKAVAAALKEIENGMPIRPSIRIQTSSNRLQSTTKLRKSDSHSLIQDLKGDLDWIALKAIEKEPKDRYETPQALRVDIENFVSGRPVEASPHTWGYLFRKSFRNYKSSWLAGFGVASCFLIAFALTSYFYFLASNSAENERQANQSLTSTNSKLEVETANSKRSATLAEEQRIKAEKNRKLAENQRDRIGLEKRQQAAEVSHLTLLARMCQLQSENLDNNSNGAVAQSIDRQLVPRRVSSQRLWQHKSGISHDGQLLATADRLQNRIRIWNLKTMELIQSFESHEHREKTDETVVFSDVAELAFHPSKSENIISVGLDGTVRIWNWESGKSICKYQSESVSPFTAMAIDNSQTNESIVVSQLDGRVVRLHLDSLDLIKQTQVFDAAIRSISISKGGLIAAVLMNETVKILGPEFDVRASEWLATNGERVISAKFEQSGTRLAVGTYEGSVFLFDVSQKKLAAKLAVFDPLAEKRREFTRLPVLAWKNEQELMVGCGNGDIRIWNTEANKLIKTLSGHSVNKFGVGDIRGLNINPQHTNQLVSLARDGTIRIWNLDLGQTEYMLDGGLSNGVSATTSNNLRFSHLPKSNQILVAGSSLDAYARLTDLKTFMTERAYLNFHGQPGLDHEGRTHAISVSPDEKKFAVAELTGEISFWNLTGDKPEKTVSAHQLSPENRNPLIPLIGLGWSSSGDVLYSIGQDHRCLVWDTESYEKLVEMSLEDKEKPLPYSELNESEFPDVRRLAQTTKNNMYDRFIFPLNETEFVTAGRDQFMRIWDWEQGHIVKRISVGGEVAALAISSDKKRMAVGTTKGLVTIYETESREPISNLLLDFSGSDQLAFELPTIGSSDKVQGKQIQADWNQQILGIAFSPNGKYIAATAGNGMLSLVEIETSKVLGRGIAFGIKDTFIRQAYPFFRADGRLFSIAEDQAIREWDYAHPVQILTRDLADPTDFPIQGAGNLRIAADGRIVISGGGPNGSIVLWNSAKDIVPKVVAPKLTDVTWVEFVPKSRDLIIADRQGRVSRYDPVNQRKIFDVTGEPKRRARRYLRSVGLLGEGGKVTASSNGKLMASTWGTSTRLKIEISKLTTGEWISDIPAPHGVESMSFDHSGNRLVFTGQKGSYVGYDLSDPNKPTEFISGNGPQFAKGLAFSPDGNMFVQAGQYFNNRLISIWRIDGTEIAPRSGMPILSNDLTADQDFLLGHQPVEKPLMGKVRIVNDVCYSPDGKWLVTAGEDGFLFIWKIEGRKYSFHSQINAADLKRIFTDSESTPNVAIKSIAFDPNGESLYAIGETGGIRTFEFAAHVAEIGRSLASQYEYCSKSIGVQLINGKPEMIERNHFLKVNVRE